jgi:hypothetical protein
MHHFKKDVLKLLQLAVFQTFMLGYCMHKVLTVEPNKHARTHSRLLSYRSIVNTVAEYPCMEVDSRMARIPVIECVL